MFNRMALEIAFVMRCLMGIEVPPFDYAITDGRKLNDYDYNVETLDFWP
jgi:hypothetical protein